MNKVRCAIYTRKSSEEGLEQDFNSLHAQREACAAYVMSQASEGWALIPDEYDDGGISGGTLERPGLRRLLADIAAQKIDIVVVYKVDRLTRSLLDFSKLVEAFDKAEVSFVSVTQSFNTTTSMGRLTLNMLLSFAQFEREVTAERIRDKIAASKARGMWMGGVPPIGYRPDGRSLAIVDDHASIIRRIFERYLSLGSVRLLAEEFVSEGIEVPARTTGSGRHIGGRPFSRGQIYHVLVNPVYVGEIHHRGKVYLANHTPIIDRETWEQVQLSLKENTQGSRSARKVQSPSMLARKLVDAEGQPLIATHACKPARSGSKDAKVRYRYYVSKVLHHDPDVDSAEGMRIPAREIEAAVSNRVAEALDDPLTLLSQAGIALEADVARPALTNAGKLATAVRRREQSLMRRLVTRVTVSPASLEIAISTSVLARDLRLMEAAPTEDTVTLSSHVRLSKTGTAIRMVQDNGRASTAGTPDPSLLKVLGQARRWSAAIATGETDLPTIARTEKISDSLVSRVVRLSFLAPQIVEAILDGTQPERLTATTLDGLDLPLDCQAQVDLLLTA
ncbi:DNA-invertase hin [Tsuneonella dongtanensis]|uniref:DNA-invertase hin n=1 Tax=Tsuneonella dongtanensis TaxID=692370 RepID=A0A1B2ABT4_9SPHN|nr:recombinase family protein [Tsuneonella dongtanensis]ANY19606.1 DNA-invertase hin [Tsuneonella dongtanensis]